MDKVGKVLEIILFSVSLVGCSKVVNDEKEKQYLEKEIFEDYYEEAQKLLDNMTLEEKVAQSLLVKYNDKKIQEQKNYLFSGYIFYEKDFIDKSKDDVIKMINEVQSDSKIPYLIAVDEEGGKVSRLSSNKEIVSTPFLGPRKLYDEGGFTRIREDVIEKSKILKELGINLNLAPVVDVSTNESDYIYPRTLGLDTSYVEIYARTVIEASKNTGVSYTLKHFPGYSNNLDTHKESSTDIKSKEDIFKIDIPPFRAGINEGAESVMISHNIVSSIDRDNPASLSNEINKILRNDLNFKGIVITDDLDMKALDNEENKEVRAILAGNNILIVSDYEKSFQNLLEAINEELITEEELGKSVLKILAWKCYKKLL